MVGYDDVFVPLAMVRSNHHRANEGGDMCGEDFKMRMQCSKRNVMCCKRCLSLDTIFINQSV